MDDFRIFDSHGGGGGDDGDKYGKAAGLYNVRDVYFQLAISVAVGLSAFLTFCVLRPRWNGLYAARKKTKNEAAVLPELPKSLFGWIVPLWKITDQQVLASAGLDAYAFLAFFKMAMKFLIVTLFFSLVVIKPVHDANPNDDKKPKHGKKHHNNTDSSVLFSDKPGGAPFNGTVPFLPDFESDYLWIYVVFAYLFSAIAIYLIVQETRKVIEVRQEYLGTQTSVTDRTIRLSGIPKELRDETKLKEFIEALDIGKVESVTLCRNWSELDLAVKVRMTALRKLEEAYTVHLGGRRVERNLESLPISQPTPPSPQANDLLVDVDDDATNGSEAPRTNGHIQEQQAPYKKERPTTRIRYGFLGMRSQTVDAIELYEEQFREADEKVKALREKTYEPVPVAFVTMDSVAACQMAIQAVLDPSPMQFIASQSPAPADVIWPNTYLSRRNRMLRSWSITVLIVLLTVFWSVIYGAIAGLLTLKTIGKVLPGFAQFLEDHKNVESLVTSVLPTLLLSLMLVIAPYLYYWLSEYQGMMSQGDVELSAISKNFFFVFVNFFIVFTLFGTASQFFAFLRTFGDAFKGFQRITNGLAVSLQKLLNFYANFIILQGLGLFPFRLLEVGSVSMYPVYRVGAKTPRDYAELVQPPAFIYSYYLPNALLIFIICMAYSVLRASWHVLLAGFVYFAFGHFVYKYQLLYAMDHQQQATGRAWVMICDRVFVGLIFFQLTTAGQLLLKGAYTRGVLIVPLIGLTIWVNILYGRTYKPLMKFIALRSVRRGERYSDYESPSPSPSPPEDQSTSSSTELAPEQAIWAETGKIADARYLRETRVGLTSPAVDESKQTGLRFMNPSLAAPLDGIWIADNNTGMEYGEWHIDGIGSGEETA